MMRGARRRYVALYLGDAEVAAFARCPAGMPRGRWMNLLAAQVAAWGSDDWTALLGVLSPRPTRRRAKLTVALRPDVAAALDEKRGGIPLADVLRTALLRAARVGYSAIPMVPTGPALVAGPGGFRAPSATPAPRPTPAVSPAPRPTPPPQPPARSPPASPPVPPPAPPREPPKPKQDWADRAATAREVREIVDAVEQSRLGAEHCHGDLFPALQVSLARWLRTEQPGAEVVEVLGVVVDDEGDLSLLGIGDIDATAEILKGVALSSRRALRGEIVRYRFGDEGTEVALTLQITVGAAISG